MCEHVGHNAHTSKRLKHKLMNRFLKYGGAIPRPLPVTACHLAPRVTADWMKVDAATPIIAHGLVLLQQTGNCETVAEYFNHVKWNDGVGFPVGPYCRNLKWDGKMIRRFYKNRILGGAVGRGFRHTVKHHESGHRKSVLSPKGPTFREYPQLAHVGLAELDRVNAQLSRGHEPGSEAHQWDRSALPHIS